MKTLLITTIVALTIALTGCESTESSTPAAQPATKTGDPSLSQPVGPPMTASEKRVMQLQKLDRQYSEGAMTPEMYHMRHNEILGTY
ncbi:MAG: hypothetical protein AAFX93_15270 [Verrucomicrobiota bacterium]